MVFCSYLLWLMVMSECDTAWLMLQICGRPCTLAELVYRFGVPLVVTIFACDSSLWNYECDRSSIIGSRDQNENRHDASHMCDVSIAYFHLLRIHRVLAGCCSRRIVVIISFFFISFFFVLLRMREKRERKAYAWMV